MIRKINIEFVRNIWRYDPSTGFLYRKSTGKKTGYTNTRGYITVEEGDKRYPAHRVIWCLYYGEQPEYIDHINGERTDNRLCNLRNCTQRENTQNKKIHREGKLLGATFCKDRNRWKASFMLKGKNIHLGYFDSAQEAHISYCVAIEHIDDFNTWKKKEKIKKVPIGISYSKTDKNHWRVRKRINGIFYDKGRFASLTRAKKELECLLKEVNGVERCI